MLTEREALMLHLAGQTRVRPGLLEQQIRDQLDMTDTRFWQVVNRLIESRAAIEHDPVTVHRLLRLRDGRRRRPAVSRSGRPAAGY